MWMQAGAALVPFLYDNEDPKSIDTTLSDQKESQEQSIETPFIAMSFIAMKKSWNAIFALGPCFGRKGPRGSHESFRSGETDPVQFKGVF